MKTCIKCLRTRPENYYLENRKKCILCRNEERNKLDTRHGDGLRNKQLKRAYGITLDDFKRMTEMQKGLCQICKQKGTNRWNDKLAVDHCHKTGKVRGLLCDKCNKGLGQFMDDTEKLSRAISYLKGTLCFIP